MSFSAKVIADSISAAGKRITTMQLCYPRFIHAEFMTHRVFSRNASSSRAIPVAKMIEQVLSNPAMPIHWGKNQPGMQAAVEHDASVDLGEHFDHCGSLTIQEAWRKAAEQAAIIAEAMSKAGYHKQVVNRILEPFQWMHVIVTATEWGNFFELRDHEDAQPEIRHLAQLMKLAMDGSIPDILKRDDWHLPYVTEGDIVDLQELAVSTGENWEDLARSVSAARCCRVSYLKHDGTRASLQEELDLCERLVGARPIHASPFEHQATPDWLFEPHGGGKPYWPNEKLHGNLFGWIQSRKLIELRFASKQ